MRLNAEERRWRGANGYSSETGKVFVSDRGGLPILYLDERGWHRRGHDVCDRPADAAAGYVCEDVAEEAAPPAPRGAMLPGM
jgi:hypothetical protein